MKVRFLGFGVSYADGMAAMREHIEQFHIHGPTLLLLEHKDTITYTRSHGLKHVLATPEELQKKGIELYETDRGGDATFHGKGQLVGYPIIRLPPTTSIAKPFEVDLVGYIRRLEHALLMACHQLGVIQAHTLPGKTGIWVENNGYNNKLIAIGVGVSKEGITKHGFAFNIATHIERFTEAIVPCGLAGFGVTSLDRIFEAQSKPIPDFSIILSEVSKQVGQGLQSKKPS